MGNLKLWNWSFEDQLFIARNIVSSGHYRYPIPRFGNFLKRNVFLVLAQKLSVGANIRPLKLLHFVHSSCGSVLVSWDAKFPGKPDEAACFASSKLQSLQEKPTKPHTFQYTETAQKILLHDHGFKNSSSFTHNRFP